VIPIHTVSETLIIFAKFDVYEVFAKILFKYCKLEFIVTSTVPLKL